VSTICDTAGTPPVGTPAVGVNSRPAEPIVEAMPAAGDGSEAGAAGLPRILVVDDDPIVRTTVVEMLARSGFVPLEAATHDEALGLLADSHVRLVVSDIVMPGLNGFELTECVRQRRPSLPVLLITGAGTDEHLSEALARGAAGLIAKPFTMAELARNVTAVLQRAESSEKDVRRRFVPDVLGGVLVSVLEARDGSVRGHCERLAQLAELIGERLGMSGAELDALAIGALLHDVGKVGIPDSILLKPGSLDPSEWTVMRSHPEFGDRLLAPFSELGDVRLIVRHHHERWDGEGYPDGLAGAQIPLLARVVAVADAIEAMSVRRPYRDPLPSRTLIAQLEEGRGRQWDPTVIDAALELIRLGGLSVAVDGASALLSGGEPVWRDDDLVAFAETKIADLVRISCSLDPVELESLRTTDLLEGGGLILPDRRRHALEILSALRDAITGGRP
jgi:cyclic di-GMP phosphodiesterase